MLTDKQLVPDIVFEDAEVEGTIATVEDYGSMRTPRGLLSWRHERLCLVQYVTRKTYEGWEYHVKDESGTFKMWVFFATSETPTDSPLGLGKSGAHYLIVQSLEGFDAKDAAKKIESHRWVPVNRTSSFRVFGSSKISWLGGADGFGHVNKPVGAEEKKMEKDWKGIKEIIQVSFQESKKNPVVKKSFDDPEHPPVVSGTKRKSTAKSGRAALRTCRT